MRKEGEESKQWMATMMADVLTPTAANPLELLTGFPSSLPFPSRPVTLFYLLFLRSASSALPEAHPLDQI